MFGSTADQRPIFQVKLEPSNQMLTLVLYFHQNEIATQCQSSLLGGGKLLSESPCILLWKMDCSLPYFFFFSPSIKYFSSSSKF